MSIGIEDAFNRAYDQAQADPKAKQQELLLYLRPKKSGNALLAVFSDGAEAVAEQLQAAENRIAQINADRESFMKLTDGQGLNLLLNELARLSRIIGNADLEARNEVQRAIKANAGMDVRAAEELPNVQAAYKKRDAAEAEYAPKIDAVRANIQKAKAILEKYRKA